MTQPATSISLAAVNSMSDCAFTATFGGIAEHAQWVAEGAANARPFEDLNAMTHAFHAAIMAAGDEAKLALLNAHPDLAGKAAINGDLTDHSTAEQAGAGLDSLSQEEYDRFTAYNEAYKRRNGFPFILAVKNASKQDILDAFARRANNDAREEFTEALRQVCRIVGFRIEATVDE